MFDPSRALGPAALLLASTLLAGCMSTQSAVAPLPAAPTTPVATTSIPPVAPPGPASRSPVNSIEAPPEPQELGTQDEAMRPADQVSTFEPDPVVSPVAAFGPVKAEMLSGGWQIAGEGSSCPLFMSTTAWKGGYRAVTRGCASPRLQQVNAWSLSGNQVVLKDEAGAEVARLTRTEEARYAGNLSSGGSVSFTR